ncbi:cupin domain-containing protein [Oscillospiraceae bacterium MB08-C2-2]|nr:cupin domain-containing protein [Oscillospiraceae bacterium MB08-C2-2]
MIRKAKDFRLEHRQIAGGNGELALHHKLSPEESLGKCRICAEIILEPGQSIGEHPHEIEAEIYYMLSGELVSISEDKSEEPFCAGDLMFTGGGNKHSVRNDSDKAAVMLAIVIY